ncbi:uncharacterized protein [Littorina saxatilis]|uniref:uncharacterized protein n=1 Tax=Littorina saxatilis TaxID=31220 RepID=UPI0038B4EDEB
MKLLSARITCGPSGAVAADQPPPELCDLHMWYLDRVTDGVFEGHLSQEQQTVKNKIETLIARTKGTSNAGRISCSTLSAFENMLLPGDPTELKESERTSKGRAGKDSASADEEAASDTTRNGQSSRQKTKESESVGNETDEKHGHNNFEESHKDGPTAEKSKDTEEATKVTREGPVSEQKHSDSKEKKAQVKHKAHNGREIEGTGILIFGLDDDDEEEEDDDENEKTDSNDTQKDQNTKKNDDEHEDKNETEIDQNTSEKSNEGEDSNKKDLTRSNITQSSTNSSELKSSSNRSVQISHTYPPTCEKYGHKCNLSEHLFPPSFESQKHFQPVPLHLLDHCKTSVRRSRRRRSNADRSSLKCYYYCILEVRKDNSDRKSIRTRSLFRAVQKSCRVKRKCSAMCLYGQHMQQCIQYYDLLLHHKSSHNFADHTKTKDDKETTDRTPKSTKTESDVSKTENQRTQNNAKKHEGSKDLKPDGSHDAKDNEGEDNDDSDDDEDDEDEKNSKGGADDTDLDDASDDRKQNESIEVKRKDLKDKHKDSGTEEISKHTSNRSKKDEEEQPRSSRLTEEELLRIEAMFQQKVSEQAAKVQSLEIMIMKLENNLLSQKLQDQNGTSHIVYLENQILRIENELLKLNQSYAALHEENEILKSRQNKHLALEHKANEVKQNQPALPGNTTKYFELVTAQQQKLTALSDLLRNQSSALHLLQLRTNHLEEQNQMLYQIVMNQTALISHVMQKLQEVSEQNLMNRQETSQLKSAMDLQSASSNLIHKLEHMLEEASPRVGNPSDRGTSPSTSSHENVNSRASSQFSSVLKFLPKTSELRLRSHHWKCEGNRSTRLCLCFTVLVSPCPPLRTLNWGKCSYMLREVELVSTGDQRLGIQTLSPEDRDILNKQGAFLGVSSENLHTDTRVMDTKETRDKAKVPADRNKDSADDVKLVPELAHAGTIESTDSETKHSTSSSDNGSQKTSKVGPTPSQKQDSNPPPTALPKESSTKETESKSPEPKEIPDSVEIPNTQNADKETVPGSRQEEKDIKESEEKVSESVSKPPVSAQILPSAVEADDGQKAKKENVEKERKDGNFEMKTKKQDTEQTPESKEDSLKHRRTLPEPVDAVSGKERDTEEASENLKKQSEPETPQTEEDVDKKRAQISSDKAKTAENTAKKKGTDEGSKKEGEEAKRKKQEAEADRKTEQQKHDAIVLAKKMQEAEKRHPPYWSADSRKPKDCYDLYKIAPTQTRNGAYKIFVKGLNLYVSVFCDMKGGGWTLLMKREDGSLDFYRGWDDYVNGFGTPFSEHYVGNEVIHYLTNQNQYSLQVDLKDWAGNTRTAHYKHFWVDDEKDNFRLHVLGYNGTAGDGLSKHDGMAFSTNDRDNDLLASDQLGGSCARRFHGAGWYYKCYMSNLLGSHYVDGMVPHKRFDGVAWKPWTGPSYSLKEVVLKVKPRAAG